jgi:hypothetical protein
VEFCYLTITTDAKTLSSTFKTAAKGVVTVRDSVNLDLTQGQILSGSHAPSGGGGKPKPAPPKRGKKK